MLLPLVSTGIRRTFPSRARSRAFFPVWEGEYRNPYKKDAQRFVVHLFFCFFYLLPGFLNPGLGGLGPLGPLPSCALAMASWASPPLPRRPVWTEVFLAVMYHTWSLSVLPSLMPLAVGSFG